MIFFNLSRPEEFLLNGRMQKFSCIIQHVCMMGNILQCPLVGIATLSSATTSDRCDLDQCIARKGCRTKTAAHCREKVKLQVHPPIWAIMSRAEVTVPLSPQTGIHNVPTAAATQEKKQYDRKAFLLAWIIPTTASVSPH